MKIVFFTVIDNADFDFVKVALQSFQHVNDYDFTYYIFTDAELNINLDRRFIVKSLKNVEPRKYHIKYNRHLMIFKFFELRKIYHDSVICYISSSVLCFKSLYEILDIDDGIYGVRDLQNNESCGGRLYARKCLAIRNESYLADSIIISHGFHVYRNDFKNFLRECPSDLLNPEMDFLNWKYKNSINFMDNSVCSNYTNPGNAVYCYDYNTDVTPLNVPDGINLVNRYDLVKLLNDFKYFKNVLNILNIKSYNERINKNENYIKNCLLEMECRESFVRRFVLHCGD